MVRYELHRARSGTQHHYFLIRAVGNSKVLATSETYYNRQDAIHAANLVRNGSAGAEFIDYASAA